MPALLLVLGRTPCVRHHRHSQPAANRALNRSLVRTFATCALLLSCLASNVQAQAPEVEGFENFAHDGRALLMEGAVFELRDNLAVRDGAVLFGPGARFGHGDSVRWLGTVDPTVSADGTLLCLYEDVGLSLHEVYAWTSADGGLTQASGNVRFTGITSEGIELQTTFTVTPSGLGGDDYDLLTFSGAWTSAALRSLRIEALSPLNYVGLDDLGYQLQTIDPCSPNPCQNGGTCSVVDHLVQCTCALGYYGQHCGCQDVDDDSCLECPSAGSTPLNDGTDTDSDGLCDAGDPDDDDDGVPDERDSAPLLRHRCGDEDQDGCDDCTALQADLHNDGLDSDQDGLCDRGDNDDDNDGVADVYDAWPKDPRRCWDGDQDSCDDCSQGPRDPLQDGPDLDGDGQCDQGDPDDDGDGSPDDEDLFPADNLRCGDRDGDTCDDCSSGHVDLQWDGPDSDGDGLCDYGDSDDDNDGVHDWHDRYPSDPYRCRDLDVDGCDDCALTGANASGGDPTNDGPDSDANGTCDLGEGDADRDGIPNPLDLDADNDGLSNIVEGTADADADGIPNHLDLDSDDDGIPDLHEAGISASDLNSDGRIDIFLDADRDGLHDGLWPGLTLPFTLTDNQLLWTLDADDDGILDCAEAGLQAFDDDGDGQVDGRDINRDGWVDRVANHLLIHGFSLPNDADGDGLLNWHDSDADNDGLSDTQEGGSAQRAYRQQPQTTRGPAPPLPDFDSDGLPDFVDKDDDGDGLTTLQEQAVRRDVDRDGLPNYLDYDSDGDGLSDRSEGLADWDADGIPNYIDPPIARASGGGGCSCAILRGTAYGQALYYGLALLTLLLRARMRFGFSSFKLSARR